MAKQYLDKTGLIRYNDKLNDKFVKQEIGKTLSSNDFTNEYKNNIDISIKSSDVKKIVVVNSYPEIMEKDVLYLKSEK